nr:cytochrome d ubiquinol oxidase subunit II [Kibdelosporangium sp. MJ126-NF4]CEL19947.1 Cytochrome d ubiquinol oxidase subunit II [Kibdelosporangium sp. MJ126-NF4]CTQ97171.1 Cytochrome d ubiquinol oxidase subunit II (EC 1.10.3.-) [Kibdelosporangium sp. MJ126-NF4]
MGYATLWLIAFGLLFAGFLALAGINYGTSLLLPWLAKTDGERRSVLNQLGPFFLANEAWLLVSIGLLIGTLPGLESRMIAGSYPVFIVAVAGSVVVNVAVQLRSRHEAAGVRKFWDFLTVVGGLAAAFGWGAFLTAFAVGYPMDATGHVTGAGEALTLTTVQGGLATVALLGAHGASFVTARSIDKSLDAVSRRAKKAALILAIAASLLTVGTVIGILNGGEHEGVMSNPVVAIVLVGLALVSLKITLWRQAKGQGWQAFATTVVAVALLPIGVLLGKYPTLVTSTTAGGKGAELADVAASTDALAAVTWVAGPVLLVVLAVQVYAWKIFAGSKERQPMFY